MKTGDRVRDDFLGAGTITKSRKEFAKECGGDIGLVVVHFDQTPAWEYNCCQNPTVAFEHQLSKETPK